MPKRILIIDGHPDPSPERLVHALAEAYRAGAEAAGHEIRMIRVSEFALPPLSGPAEWEADALPDAVAAAQQDILWCQHMLLVYPLWMAMMPAKLKLWFEQVCRPAFAFGSKDSRSPFGRVLKGRSARVVVTMGMPGFAYRLIFGAHSLKALKTGILGLVGIKPIKDVLIGGVDAGPDKMRPWLEKMRRWGRDGA